MKKKCIPIPAIDLIDGQCVRLTRGDFLQKVIYSVSPIEMALRLEDAGLDHLHLVDLMGAKKGKATQLNLIESIARGTRLKIDAGGGIRSLDDMHAFFDRGVRQINLGTVLLQNASLAEKALSVFGPERLIAAVDVSQSGPMLQGWSIRSKLSTTGAIDHLYQVGYRIFTVTGIERDGTLGGPDLKLYQRLNNRQQDIQLIASGGVSGLADMDALSRAGLYGAIIGKAIFENRIDLNSLFTWLNK